jgi:transcriptional regulator with XRE-family HTH domain
MKENDQTSINHRIAARVRELRAAKGFSLEHLAQVSEVSRSMISVIERGESSATAVVLEKIAAGLGVALVSLFDSPKKPCEPVARAKDNLPWRDPQSGYLRRNVSPGASITPIQIVEVVFPAKARVAYESVLSGVIIHQQVWVIEGAMDVSIGKAIHHLRVGDCLAFELNQPVVYFNPSSKAAKYAVVIVSQ